MTTNFVPTSEINKLVLGSHERLAMKLDAAISVSAAKIFGESAPSQVERIGTFDSYVIVAANDGRFARVNYTTDINGKVVIGESTAAQVPTFTENTVHSYLLSEAQQAVASFMVKDGETALSRLRELAQILPESHIPPAAEVLESAVKSISAPRPWKRVLASKMESITSFLKEGATEATAKGLFYSLDPKTAGYQTKAVANAKLMAESMNAAVATLPSMADVASLMKSATAKEDPKLVEMFGSFIEDLRDDVSSVVQSISQAIVLENLDSKIEALYTALVAELPKYEMACAFAALTYKDLTAKQ